MDKHRTSTGQAQDKSAEDLQQPTLNLPSAELTPAPLMLREVEGRTCVFDPLRQRWVALTPEERVRQLFVRFLIEHRGYPAALMGNEISLTVGNTRRRCDTVVYGPQAQPRMLVEYKAPHVNVNQKVMDQIARYNMALHVDYLTVSNGLKHYCLRMDYGRGTYTFLPDIPRYEEL